MLYVVRGVCYAWYMCCVLCDMSRMCGVRDVGDAGAVLLALSALCTPETIAAHDMERGGVAPNTYKTRFTRPWVWACTWV